MALYGRMINNAEHQPAFIEHLRAVADGHLGPAEAVRSYHGALQRHGIRPLRSLADDLQPTQRAAAYSGAARPSATAAPGASEPDYPTTPDGRPDFARMTNAQKIAWNRRRWQRILG